MKNAENLREIDYPVYMAATLLAEALGVFGDAETIKAYDDSVKAQKDRPGMRTPGAKPKPVGLLVALSESGAVVENNVQDTLLTALKNQVAALVMSGDLSAVGFRTPRASEDDPVILPDDIFSTGEINWDKSEIMRETTAGTEWFTGVRLLQAPGGTVKTNKFHRSGTLIAEAKKPGKAIKPAPGAHHSLTEKEAAAYLGMSRRNLQALRVKSQGPEFSRLGMAVRYKKDDLVTWQDKPGTQPSDSQ